MDYSDFERQLVRHEGLRLKPYLDSVGKLTIGVGRNLDDNGITEPEAMYLLRGDISRHEEELVQAFPIVRNLSRERFFCLLNMAFNLGIPRLKTFRNMWDAIHRQDWERAADEMLASRWAKQVGRRAMDLADIMRTGIWMAG